MKRRSKYIFTTFITLLAVLLLHLSFIFTQEQDVIISAPNNSVNVTVKEDVRKLNFKTKGWLCGENYTALTLEILAKLNTAVVCYEKGSVDGSKYISFKKLYDDVIPLSEIILRNSKESPIKFFAYLTQYKNSNFDFNKTYEAYAVSEEKDPEGYAETLVVKNCYTEDDLQKLMTAWVDAANRTVEARKKWQEEVKKKEEEAKKKEIEEKNK